PGDHRAEIHAVRALRPACRLLPRHHLAAVAPLCLCRGQAIVRDAAPEPLLTIRGLSKFYSDIAVLDRVDLDVAPSEIVMIIGPSGAGKSTLLRCVNRIEQPSEGEIVVAGTRMTGERKRGRLVAERPTELAVKRRKIGMVFQRFNLFAHLSALD